MPSQKLIDLIPGKGIEAGLYPSAEAAGGQTWQTGVNVWFRELELEHSLGRQKILPVIGRQSQIMANTFTQAGAKRLYWEDLGIINYWEGAAPILIGSLNSNGDYDLEPWGDWLLATDNIGHLQLWQNTGTFATLTDAATQFSTCRFVKKLAQHILAYATDILPNGFHWCSASDPTTWTPSLTNSARNLNIRNADSAIIAVETLGPNHAVYFRDSMLMVQYVGPTDWFGTPSQAVSGIGAVSKHSIVALGNFNFGLSRDGIFTTDGTTASFIDRPAIDKWLQANVDWSQQSTISGYWDGRLGLVIWTVPLVGGGRTAVAMDPKLRTVTAESIYLSRKTFTFLDGQALFGLEREVFDQPILSLPDGIYYGSLSGTVAGNFALTSWLFDGGNPEIFKSWDYAILTGAFGSGQIRFGYSDVPDFSQVLWDPWQPLAARVPFGPREAVYLAIDFKATDTFRLASLKVYGEPGGNVN